MHTHPCTHIRTCKEAETCCRRSNRAASVLRRCFSCSACNNASHAIMHQVRDEVCQSIQRYVMYVCVCVHACLCVSVGWGCGRVWVQVCITVRATAVLNQTQKTPYFVRTPALSPPKLVHARGRDSLFNSGSGVGKCQ